ncbi:MAG TPA: hypothetical protein QF753_01555 [Victivallales bacterium]|nr:hypothetical protein [Victivallales bacterium]
MKKFVGLLSVIIGLLIIPQMMYAKQNTFRYDCTGNWYKGNTHTHSTFSDGTKTPQQLDKLYASKGYSFIFLTDHHVSSNVKVFKFKQKLLWLDGNELGGNDSHGTYYHILTLGKTEGISKKAPLADQIAKAKKEGAILILAHPSWCGDTIAEALRYNLDGCEIYNNVCHQLNGKGLGQFQWNGMLEKNSNTIGTACDDTHMDEDAPGWAGGWIVINASSLTRTNVMDAIRNGNFYASTGPKFNDITFDGKEVHIKTSPVKMVWVVGPSSDGFGKSAEQLGVKAITEYSFKVPKDWKYIYIKIQDKNNKYAWTNTLFKHEVKK